MRGVASQSDKGGVAARPYDSGSRGVIGTGVPPGSESLSDRYKLTTTVMLSFETKCPVCVCLRARARAERGSGEGKGMKGERESGASGGQLGQQINLYRSDGC